jgi:hypothetical protein
MLGITFIGAALAARAVSLLRHTDAPNTRSGTDAVSGKPGGRVQSLSRNFERFVSLKASARPPRRPAGRRGPPLLPRRRPLPLPRARARHRRSHPRRTPGERPERCGDRGCLDLGSHHSYSS